jgi:hypothetical protein
MKAAVLVGKCGQNHQVARLVLVFRLLGMACVTDAGMQGIVINM